MNNFFELLMLLKYPLIGLFLCMAIFSFYWDSICNFFHLKKYDNIQRVHKNEVSRLGGLLVFLFLCSILFLGFFENHLFQNILISAVPFLVISLKEDLIINTEPKNRLIVMTLSCFIFFYINPVEFPKIDIPYLENFISFYPISIIFFTFAILVVMNGTNLIDGINGLFGLTALFQLCSIILLAINVKDVDIVNLCIVLILPLLIFLLFNFPLGKIFAGDSGAYFYGFVNSIICIYLFGKYENLLSWLAVLIMLYPCFELLFSFIRKIYNNVSPLKPDLKHLHSLIFKSLIDKKVSIMRKHICVLAILTPFITIPFIAIHLLFINLLSVTLISLSFVFAYIGLYIIVKKY